MQHHTVESERIENADFVLSSRKFAAYLSESIDATEANCGKEDAKVTHEDCEQARAILSKLYCGDDVTDDEQEVLTAVINQNTRPSWLPRGQYFKPDHWAWRDRFNEAVVARISPMILSVGAIAPQIPGWRWFFGERPSSGTAFVVGEDLVMTNKHVAALFTTGTSPGKITSTKTAGLTFYDHDSGTNASKIIVTEAVFIHPVFDIAILRVPGISKGRQILKLSTQGLLTSEKRDVACIGYPGASEGENKGAKAVFGNLREYRRVSPGQMWTTNHPSGRVMHDASTIGGSSGSPLIDLDTGEVIAIHSATSGDDSFNVAISSVVLAADPAVRATGVQFGINS